ncbi:hypothetical protein KP509_21G084300 [Ceratopteris richardii]|uniref:Pentatricopeptide repeat-containing protein n=1 Tax=Ceratopteris richardii TaxID=49495 RepID=A0A8T2SFE4_CERRI|nr:hypothetical protein KP509_21G084300 [Ceratopteris richardii]
MPDLLQVFALRGRVSKHVLWIYSFWISGRPLKPLKANGVEGEDFQDENANCKELSISFVLSLKACANRKDVREGSRLHDDIDALGLLGKNVHLWNTLVSMYAKCGDLNKARQVFDEMLVRNAVSWNALIVGYLQQGDSEAALDCFEQMYYEGVPPDEVTYACILKVCGLMRDSIRGEKFHDEVKSQGLLDKHVMLGNTLIDMYAKCGFLAKAHAVLNELHVRDVVSWSTMIAGYVDHGKGEQALSCFRQMQEDGCTPNAITYTSLLKACGITHDVHMGLKLHDEVVNQGLLEKSRVLCNALIDMYAKLGALSKAHETLFEVPFRDAVSWSFLIAGYMQQGRFKEALSCFHQMRSEELFPDASTYACILKACGIIQDARTGKSIHDEILRRKLLEQNLMLGSAVVDMYIKCDLLAEAQKYLSELPVRDVVSWSVLISGYVQEGMGKEALKCFDKMQSEGIIPNAITYASVLKACGITRLVEKGKEIHKKIVEEKLLEVDIVLGNSLIDMYVKCDDLAEAKHVLIDLPVRDTVSWSTLITGYVEKGQCIEAFNCFQKMLSDDLSPDAVTYASVLKACGIMQDPDRGKSLHVEISAQGLVEKHILLGNSLVDMYVKCGIVNRAQEVLDGLHIRDVVSWSTMIAGYVEHGKGEEALCCFEQMQSEGVSPNSITYACILKACGITRNILKGKQIHAEIAKQGLLKQNVVLGNCLVDMYVKCGVLTKAQETFDTLPVQDVISWNALIAGYAQEGQGDRAFRCLEQMHNKGLSLNVFTWNSLIGGYAQEGHAVKALDIFQQMEHEGTSPDAVTFVCLINACSHSGLVDEGQMFFESMVKEYGVTPNKEHFTCMVDLFARAEDLYKALRVIEQMPSTEYSSAWSALLGACRKWGNVKIGRLAFNHAIQLNGCDAASYVSMANIYATSDMQEESQKFRILRVESAIFEYPVLSSE